jgi:Calx-beta domain-containing protein
VDRITKTGSRRPGWGRIAQFAALPALLVVPSLAASTVAATLATPSPCAPAWSIVPSPNPSGTNRLAAVSALSPTRAWAVGHSIDAGGAELPLVARWDGSTWAGTNPAAAAAGNSRLTGVAAIAQGDVVAVGYTVKGDGSEVPLVERWDGTTWTASNPDAGDGKHRLLAVAASGGSDVTAVGYTDDGTSTTPLALRWNGSAWTAAHFDAGAGDHQLAAVTAISASDIVAVGTTTTLTGKQPLVLRWNGSVWSASNPSPGLGDHELRGVDATAANDVVAVGVTTTPTGKEPLVLRWNGTSWTATNPSGTAGDDELNAVSAVAAGDIWAVGRSSGSTDATLAMHWDGSAWTVSPIPNGAGASVLDGVSARGALDVWAVGRRGTATLVEHYGPCPPSVSTDPATGVTQTAATLRGTVIPNGAATDYQFQYGTTTAYGSTTPTTAAGTGMTSVPAAASVGGLTPGTTYHFRIVATNSGGTSYGDDASFAAAAAPTVSLSPRAPSVTEQDSGSQAITFTATLSAATSQTVTVHWATANGSATAGADYAAASGDLTFTPGDTSETFSVSVLGDDLDEADETFTVALSSPSNASVAAGTSTVTITDNDTKPSATTDPASSVGQTSATLNGTVNPNGKATTYRFEWGPTTAYGSSTQVAGAGSGSSPVAVTAIISGLTAGKTYHFRVVATSAAGTTFGGDQAFTTAQPAIALSPLSPTVTEGDGGSTNVAFTVALSAASAQTITVAYATANGTATAGQDYTAVGGTVTFVPGDTSEPIAVAVLGDNLDEADETFTLALSGPTNASIASGSATVLISDDDTKPTAITGSATGVGETTATLQGTVNPQGKATSVTFEYGPTAAYGSTTPAQSLAAGASPQAVSAALSGLDASSDYHYRVVATSPAGSSQGGDQVLATTDPKLAVAATPASATEPDNVATTNATFTVTLSSRSSRTVTVAYSAVGGTAAAGEDFAPASGTLTFSGGQTTKTVLVTVKGDNLDEDDETFQLHLASQANATIATADATFTILDNDAQAKLSVNDPVVTEGTGGATTLTFNVALAPASGRTVTVLYATQNGTAVAPADFTAVSGTLTFAKGETTKQVSVSVVADSLYEVDETLSLKLSSAVKADLADDTGVATIRNDDAAPSMSIDDQSVTEGETGTKTMTFTVTLCGPGTGGSGQPACSPVASGLPATAAYATADGSATAPSDYTAVSGTVTVPVGSKTVTISVTVNGDLTFELDETFGVALTSIANATVAKPAGTGTIRNDDVAPSFIVGDASSVEGGLVTFTVTLCAPGTGGSGQPACAPRAAGVPMAVNYSAESGTACGLSPPALAGLDFVQIGGQRSIVSGNTTTTFTIQTKGDKVEEPDKKLCAQILMPEGGVGLIVRRWGTGTIIDDDSPPTVSINDVRMVEGDGGSSFADFTVTFTNPSELCTSDGSFCGASVKWSTVPGTALPADFAAASGTVTMDPPDATSFAYELAYRVKIAVVTDALDEPDEQFMVVLSAPRQATIAAGRGTGTATIVDDDAPPAASTAAASDVTRVAATLNGTVNPSSKTTTVWYELGPTASYGSRSSSVDLAADSAGHGVPIAVGGLQFGTLYHFRAVAQNATGTTYGADGTFTTLYPPPVATTGAASGMTADGATVSGTAKTYGLETSAWFDYGLSEAYGSTTSAKTIAPGPQDADVSEVLSGLAPKTVYHYRLVTKQGDVVVQGADRTFQTLERQTVERPTTRGATAKLPTFNVGADGAVSGSSVTFRVGCTRAKGRCRGTIGLEASRRDLQVVAGNVSWSIGRSSFTARPGKIALVKVRLSARALRVLRKTHRLTAVATITVRDGVGKAAPKKLRLILRLPPKRTSAKR